MCQDNASQPLKDGAYYKKQGWPFQLLLCASFVHRCLVLKAVKEQDLPTAVNIVDSVGLAIFLYYLILIYVKRPKGLITTGLFKYTRHPMYTGMLMMAIRLWWPSDPGYTADYWVTIALFLIGVFTAGYLQEKETLSRFGQEAEDYYRRTPRLFLLYPFR